MALAGCQPLVEDLPDTNPVGGVVNPTIPPTAPPGPTPTNSKPGIPKRATATPTAGGTSTPTKTPTPSGGGGGNCNISCPRISGAFMNDYVKARDKAKQQHPGYFNGAVIKSGSLNGTSYRDLFTKAVADNMKPMGYNASLDPNDKSEIRVKRSGVDKCTGFSEQYQVLSSFGNIRGCPDCYRATCTPAWF